MPDLSNLYRQFAVSGSASEASILRDDSLSERKAVQALEAGAILSDLS
jgi:hypothetical protein